MDFEFDFEKIKNVPWYIAHHAFWATLIVIGLAVLIGLGLGYKYVYIVQQMQPEVPELTNLNQQKLQKTLDDLNTRKEKFEKTFPPSYNLFKND